METQTIGEFEEIHSFQVVDLTVPHRPLKQSNSVSYDVPLMINPQTRALSVDHTAEAKQVDEVSNTTGISASSSEHDNQETNAWSSDYSNSEDEYTILEENAVPVSFVSNFH